MEFTVFYRLFCFKLDPTTQLFGAWIRFQPLKSVFLKSLGFFWTPNPVENTKKNLSGEGADWS